MSTTLLLLFSGVLIGTGVSLIWRDIHKRRRSAFVLQRDTQSETAPQPDVEITIARPDAAAKPGSRPAGGVAPGAGGQSPAVEPVSAALDSQTVAQRWNAMQPMFGAALRQVNLVLAAARVEVSGPGPPSRSINGAHGANCRVLIAGENVGSLRLQVTIHDQVHARVKAHGKEASAINLSASVPVHDISAARASDLLSEVLKPAAAFALGASAGEEPEQRASRVAWEAVDPIVASALEAANGAMAQASSRFVAIGPAAWDTEARRHRVTVAIQVMRNEVARMYIERGASEMEVAVGVSDVRLVGLGRRRRIALQGMTTHALAELIAECAWPAIGHFRETQVAH
jgi:hypothetical protein